MTPKRCASGTGNTLSIGRAFPLSCRCTTGCYRVLAAGLGPTFAYRESVGAVIGNLRSHLTSRR